MPFIRLCDSYIDHPKFTALSASAFRLWHEGMAFCRKHQTDGAISQVALSGFRYYQPARVKELTTHLPGEGGPLWEPREGFGYNVRNYLKWNLSRDEDDQKKQGSKVRSSRWRSKRFENAVRDASLDAHEPNTDMDRSSSSQEKMPRKPIAMSGTTDQVLADRAASLLASFDEQYSALRHGAKQLRIGSNLDWTQAIEICRTWDDERVKKMIDVFLTTDDPWISGTDRGWNVFVKKATWCDERLSTWQATQARRA